jgi:sulfite exporter TauE/SafE
LSLETLGIGFALGVTSGVGCALTCIPILAPRIAGSTPSLRGGLASSTLFSVGRFFSYMLLGVGVSLIGQTLVGQALQAEIYPVALFVLGLVMVAYGISLLSGLRIGFSKYCQYFKGQKTTLVLGFTSSFSFCVPLVVALSYVVGLENLFASVLFMAAFWFGTAIYMTAVGTLVGGAAKVGGAFTNIVRIRRICGYASIMIGTVFLLNLLSALLGYPQL